MHSRVSEGPLRNPGWFLRAADPCKSNDGRDRSAGVGRPLCRSPRKGFHVAVSAAGLDDELADSLYALDREPASHAFYVDAAETLRRLHEIGGRVAVVSDIHFDLRPEFEAAGIADYVDAFVLSFEHRVQKPDLRIFQLALDALRVAASRTLMIGDRASRDGGAVALGITTLLHPAAETASEPRGLRHALALAQVDA